MKVQNDRSLTVAGAGRRRGARTPAFRVETYLDTVAGQQHSVESWRRRHTARLECV